MASRHIKYHRIRHNEPLMQEKMKMAWDISTHTNELMPIPFMDHSEAPVTFGAGPESPGYNSQALHSDQTYLEGQQMFNHNHQQDNFNQPNIFTAARMDYVS